MAFSQIDSVSYDVVCFKYISMSVLYFLLEPSKDTRIENDSVPQARDIVGACPSGCHLCASTSA